MLKRMIDEKEMKAQEIFIKQWAYKKMQKLEKKLRRKAKIYFSKPVAIVYVQEGVKVIHQDGSESKIRVPED